MWKYEVTYYEDGLTIQKSRKFFTAIATLICYCLVILTNGVECYARIYELKHRK
jgi:hypothetical protein